MFIKNIEDLKNDELKNFDKFVYFSFPNITTYLNKKNIEKKKPYFKDVEWKFIKTKTINLKHDAFAIICGKISNLTVIDIDNIDTYNNLITKYGFLKNVFKVETKKGVHLYFNYNKDIETTTNAFTNYLNVDIRNDDSIIFIPPTKYKMLNGDIYKYKFIGGELLNIPNEFLSEFKQFSKKDKIQKKININKNMKNNNSLIDSNVNKLSEIENLIYKLPSTFYDDYNNWINIGFIIFNELGLDGFNLFNKWSEQSDKYDFDEVKKKYNSFQYKNNGLTIASLYKYHNDIFGKQNYSNNYDILINFTTGDNADYFKKKYGKKFIFSNGVLYYFNDIYFKSDDKNYSFLNNFINDIYFFELFNLFQQYEIQELKKINNNDIDKKDIFKKIDTIKKKILDLKNHKTRKNFIDDIICKITDNEIKWNQCAHLFAFENKIFNIDLNKFVNPLPEFFINVSCGWYFDDLYDKNLIIELDKFIDTIHPNKEIKKLYLTILSTGLSGQTLEKFIIANGKGGNGKGVLNELALDTFGNYGYILPSNIILQPLKTGSNPELANCTYKRFVIMREPDDNYKINCATVKELTGGKDINARLNHSNETDTKLNLTLVMECNEKPKLSEVGDGMRRRVLDIPFNSSFIDKCAYDKLDDELKSNTFISNKFYKTNEFRNKYKQALFMILINYYYEYNNFGSLIIPDIIEERTMNYMSDSDEIYNIINDILLKTNDKNDFVKLKDLYELAKNNNIFINMSKEQKRNFNYKNFCSKLENNLFLKHYVCLNSDKIKILKNHKINDFNNE